jgi:uncharacterized protein (TIGR02246 family)
MYRPYPSPLDGSGSSGSVESTIRDLSQDFRTAFNTGNYDQVAALFSGEGVFMAPHHEPAVGPKAIERKLREFGDNGYQDLRVETTRVDYSGDMAMEIGRYNVSIVKENGNAMHDRGKYLAVWRRLGAWRLVAECWSSNLPAATAEATDKPMPVAEKMPILSDDAGKTA